MSNYLKYYEAKVIKELGELPEEKIGEVIDFIGYLKSKKGIEGRKKSCDIKDNPLLSLVGIGESSSPHDLAQNHDKYVYPVR